MSHLDGSAIKEVERLTREADPIVERNARPGSIHIVRDSAGDLDLFEVPVREQGSTLLDVASLKILADRMSTAGWLDVLYVSDSAITLVNIQDDDMHTWRDTLQLPLHPAFKHVLSWKDGKLLDQKALVRLLRTELRDYVTPDLIATFSNLKFTNNAETTSQLRPTSHALDQSIRQRVAQDNDQDAPEVIRLNLPVYDIPEARGDTYEVNVYVEYDHDQRKFLLMTVHGDLRHAQETAVQVLIKDLTAHAGDRFPVLYGTPLG